MFVPAVLIPVTGFGFDPGFELFYLKQVVATWCTNLRDRCYF